MASLRCQGDRFYINSVAPPVGRLRRITVRENRKILANLCVCVCFYFRFFCFYFCILEELHPMVSFSFSVHHDVSSAKQLKENLCNVHLSSAVHWPPWTTDDRWTFRSFSSHSWIFHEQFSDQLVVVWHNAALFLQLTVLASYLSNRTTPAVFFFFFFLTSSN